MLACMSARRPGHLHLCSVWFVDSRLAQLSTYGFHHDEWFSSVASSFGNEVLVYRAVNKGSLS